LELLESAILRKLVENAQNLWCKPKKMELLNFERERTKVTLLKLSLRYD
jgi:hypothetical protein